MKKSGFVNYKNSKKIVEVLGISNVFSHKNILSYVSKKAREVMGY